MIPKVGQLLRWFDNPLYCDDDTEIDDDVGIVIGLPGEDWSGCYRIAWSVENAVGDHSPDQLEESLYKRQLEIVL